MDDHILEDDLHGNLRLPPHSIEAEHSVLGGLLLDNDALDKISSTVHEEDFYRKEHRIIFRTIAQLINDNNPADVVTVNAALELNGETEEAGGLAYLISLAESTPSAANIVRYAELVRERSILRKLAQIGNDIASNAYTPNGKNARDQLDDAENSIFQITEQADQGQKGFQAIAPLINEVYKYYTEHLNHPVETLGTPTGYTQLDRLTSGLMSGNLIIIAGRPSMGKTAFAMNIVENIGIDLGRKRENLDTNIKAKAKQGIAVFSMEMGTEELMLRMISSQSGISADAIKKCEGASAEQLSRFSDATGKLSDAPIHIDETSGLSIFEVRSRARRLARQYENGLALIVIDYIQLMSGSGKSENRTLEVSEISRGLKALAKELKVPVIALSQLSRNAEYRSDRRPMMSDLRESGAIEQDADVVIFMFREPYYLKPGDDGVLRDAKGNEVPKDKAEAIVSKNRNGATGSIPLSFEGAYTHFNNRVDDYHSRYES